MRIREMAGADLTEVLDVIARAFAPTGESEEVARLVRELSEDPGYQPRYSLVAEEDGHIVGHVLLSLVFAADDEPLLLLAPLAVAPEHQQAGIGAALVTAALTRAAEDGARMVLVYGDPAYYGHFGFSAKAAGRITPPHPYFEPGWQAVVLGDGGANETAGPLRVPAVLDVPEMWEVPGV